MAPRKDTKTAVSIERIETKLDLFKEHLDKQLSNMDGKLDRIDSRVDVIEVTLGKQYVSIDEHVKRTNLLEERMHAETTELKSKIDSETRAIKENVEPLKFHRMQLKLALKIIATVLGAGAAGGGAGLGLHKLLELFGG